MRRKPTAELKNVRHADHHVSCRFLPAIMSFIDARRSTFNIVGGDQYNFHMIDDHTPPGSVGFEHTLR
jgi:hypothetical protein